MTSTPDARRRVIVIGGGLAAMLTAAALREDADVTVIERDALPDTAAPRKGLPQANHAHLLWSGGADAIETLLPGTAKALAAAGAHRIPLTRGMVAYSPRGWYRRWDESHYVIGCSRDRLDAIVREQLLPDERITVREETVVVSLTGGAAAVTGVRIRTTDGLEETLAADLVVDASGRSSRTPEWLKALGLEEPDTRTVDSGLVYASRIYQAPEGLPADWPIINVQADPAGDGPGQGGVILPIEDGRWMVTLFGTRGGQPTASNDDFVPFAKALRHPIIGDILDAATPLTDVTTTRTTVNRRRFYEKTTMPEGLAVIGDATGAFNPTYGHGMSVAAQGAVSVRDTVRARGWTPGLARRIQKAVARPVNTAWTFATGTDVFYDGATENGPTFAEKAAAALVSRLVYTSTGSGRMARALTDVMVLDAGPETLARPSTLIAAVRGPLKPQLTEPPLTAEERKAVHL
ncbi:NAD(P)/FAD-dependent oxidoreductase [Streptomyces sp. NPDC051362]|uniref:NAD(P)/FAD-dependent oxidoreductase n=1 Tax=Streptomyces sp. NPDC051362 TaxID=3365651 RepID=UPI0037A69C4C